MKKKAVVCTLFALLLLLASCGKEPIYLDDIYPDSETVPFDDLLGEQEANPNWQPIPDYDPSIPHAEPIASLTPKFVETKHCIVFQDNRGNTGLRYINKATGEAQLLCGDPLCDHANCSAFPEVVSLVYSPETGRLYWVRRCRRITIRCTAAKEGSRSFRSASTRWTLR